jgi:hypothetical protein
MSVEAPVQPSAPAEEVPSTNAPGPEAQERIVFGPIMVLLIVPLYVLIMLTLKPDMRYRLETLARAWSLDFKAMRPYFRMAYDATIIGLCALAPAYALLNAIRLSRRGVRPGYLLTAWICVLLAAAEAAAIAMVVYHYKVTV